LLAYRTQGSPGPVANTPRLLPSNPGVFGGVGNVERSLLDRPASRPSPYVLNQAVLATLRVQRGDAPTRFHPNALSRPYKERSQALSGAPRRAPGPKAPAGSGTLVRLSRDSGFKSKNWEACQHVTRDAQREVRSRRDRYVERRTKTERE